MNASEISQKQYFLIEKILTDADACKFLAILIQVPLVGAEEISEQC